LLCQNPLFVLRDKDRCHVPNTVLKVKRDEQKNCIKFLLTIFNTNTYINIPLLQKQTRNNTKAHQRKNNNTTIQQHQPQHFHCHALLVWRSGYWFCNKNKRATTPKRISAKTTIQQYNNTTIQQHQPQHHTTTLPNTITSITAQHVDHI
jgi:hypothetical protein